MIGSVTVGHVVWEVWSDGHAYSSDNDHWKRTKAGTWLPYGIKKDRIKNAKNFHYDWIIFSEVSEALEGVFSLFILKIITEE